MTMIWLKIAGEMDWNRSGKVSFRQFLFAFLDWVGIDTDDEKGRLRATTTPQPN